MHIGIAFDLKPTTPLPAGAPDDLHEEFDSPVTVKAIGDVLRNLGHTVSELGDGRSFLEGVLKNPPELVFNIAEGTGVGRSREARVPAVCEMLAIPCTGSDPLALAVALDKDMTRRIAETAGATIPKGLTLTFPHGEYDGGFAEFPPLLAESGLPLPVIAKPICEGSSKGIRNRCLIRTAEDFGPTVVGLWRDYQQPVLVEEFVSGDEVTIGIVGNDPPQPLGIMRVLPRKPTDHFIYSLEAKRNYADLLDYEAPAKISKDATRAVEEAALNVYTALGCRDVARADFRIRDGVPHFIEINPLPGLNPESSDLCYLAYRLNMKYADLIKMILDTAVLRCGLT